MARAWRMKKCPEDSRSRREKQVGTHKAALSLGQLMKQLYGKACVYPQQSYANPTDQMSNFNVIWCTVGHNSTDTDGKEDCLNTGIKERKKYR